MERTIPFKDNSAHLTDDFCTERRIRETIAFIRPADMVNVADVGEKNYVGCRIRKHFHCELLQIEDSDFNWALFDVSTEFQTILCLEVIEHLMNPAFFLFSLWHLLSPGGVLYLSTPVHNPLGFTFNPSCHFAEYRVESVRKLLEYSGFTITDFKKFKSIPMWEGYKHGAGPITGTLRMLSQETQLWRATK